MGLLARAARRLHRAFDFWGTEGWTIVRGADVGQFQRDGKTVRLVGWEQHPVVQACMRLVVDIIAAVPFETVRQRRDGGVEVLADHDLTALLDEPQPGLPGMQHRALTALDFLAYGNAMWDIQRNGNRNRPKALALVHPESVNEALLNSETGRVVRYTWTVPETGRIVEKPVEDVVHFADLSGRPTRVFGYPRAAAALQDIIADTEASKYVRQVVGNDGSPSLVFLVHEQASRTDAEAAEARWHEKRVMRGERGKVHFSNVAKDVKQIGFNLSELEFPDLRRVTREDICAVFGVDPRMVGISSAASDGGLSGEQYREARRRLIAQAATPLMLALEAKINVWLAPEFGEVRVRFSPNGLAELTENELETSQRAISEYSGGLRTLEEARDMVGLESERDPTHHIKAGFLGEIAVADLQAMTTITAGRQPLGILGPGQHEEEDEEENEERVAWPLKRVALTSEQRAQHWRGFDARARALEPSFEAVALAVFAAERKDVAAIVAQVRASDPPLTQAEVDILIRALRELFNPQGPARQRWLDRMTGPTADVMRIGALDMAGQFDIAFDVANPRIQAVIRTRTDRLAQHVTETSAAAIEVAVRAGQERGWGVNQTAQLINETVYGGMARQRATMIARTETIGALNEAQHLTAQEARLTSKEWLTQGDKRVRDSHQDLDGQRVDIGGAFANGLRFPGDPMGEAAEIINCRCTLLYE